MDNDKMGDFRKYCPICKHSDLDENEEPCDSCLTVPLREGTEKPEKWEKNGKND